ncbi:hypothetical protein [Meiothermus hypogaeus]|uniref:hypothetical protein n=1 Tax=Meiothermus hypogaeus TaxID=884155 RepID=UPI001FCFCA90|nr:hypothetical protein [Meiothermus hypogaeus]
MRGLVAQPVLRPTALLRPEHVLGQPDRRPLQDLSPGGTLPGPQALVRCEHARRAARAARRVWPGAQEVRVVGECAFVDPGVLHVHVRHRGRLRVNQFHPVGDVKPGPGDDTAFGRHVGGGKEGPVWAHPEGQVTLEVRREEPDLGVRGERLQPAPPVAVGMPGVGPDH